MKTLSMPRESYVPTQFRSQTPTTPEGTDLSVWTYEIGARFVAVIFHGKSSKPLVHTSFRSAESRQTEIDRTAAGRRVSLKMKQDMRDERKNYTHDFKVGDILNTSWGYDQTNVEFFEVVEVRGAMIVVREIEQKLDHSVTGSDLVVPVPGKFVGPELKRKPSVGGGVKTSEVARATRWNGRPARTTAAGYGH